MAKACMTAQTSSPSKTDTSGNADANQWQIELLYDSDCPLCMREVNFLQRKDAGRGLVSFVDIADLNYDPDLHGGIDYRTAMGRIHALLADGSVIQGVEVFRRVYKVLGMGWVYAATKWPVVGPLVDTLYDLWAAKRLAMTGRPDLAEILRDRQQKREDCGDRCRMNF